MLDLTEFLNPVENIFVFKKWDWDYLEAQEFQLECVEYVRNNPHISIFIICSHLHCFTVGRGLQKIKDSDISLVDFDLSTSLPFSVHTIKRGGGLTFHYPGQFVFYPIINLTHHKKAIYDLMINILEITKKTIEEKYQMSGLIVRRDLLGLWFENEFSKAKLASIGLAASRFNTYHGLALNFIHDKEMFQALLKTYPCGLPGDLYKDLEILTCQSLSEVDREKFTNKFLQEIYFIMDKQRSSSLINSSI